jgi:hypothetical protein
MSTNLKLAIESIPKHWLLTKMIRPLLAWGVACVVASFVIVLVAIGATLIPVRSVTGLATKLAEFVRLWSIVSMFTALLTMLPMVGVIFVIDRLQLRRGWSDTILSGLMGALLIQVFGVGFLALGTAFFATSLFFFAGAIGGFTYWYLAGQPKPPY